MRTQLDAAREELAAQTPELLRFRTQAALREKVVVADLAKSQAAAVAQLQADLAKSQAAAVSQLQAQHAAALATLQAEPEFSSYHAGPAVNSAAGGAAGGSAGGAVHAAWEAAPAAAQGAAPEAAEVALDADAVDVAIHGIMDPNLGGEGDMWVGEGWDPALR